MTRLLTEDFGEGTNNTAITSTNTSAFTFATPGAWIFSNAQVPPGGAMAGRVSTTSANATMNPGTAAWAATNVTYWRFYLYVSTAVNTNASIFSLRNGTALSAEVRLTTTGGIQIRNTSGVQVALSPNLATPGRWVRVEGKLDAVADTHQFKVWAGTNLNSSTPDYDSGAVTSAGATATTNIAVGVVSAATAVLYFDNIAVDNAAFIGPSGDQPPTCSASASAISASAGATVNLTGTDADPDGTIVSRAWTQTSGTSVGTITGASTASASFTVPSVATGSTLKFTYTVTDNSGSTASSTVTVTALASSATIAIRSSAQSNVQTSAAAATITIPTTGAGGTVVAGDLALLFMSDQGIPVSSNMRASGWQLLSSSVTNGVIGLRVWGKPLVAGDPGSTVSVSSTVDGTSVYRRALVMVIYSGAVIGDAWAAQDGANAAAHTAPTANAVSTNAAVVNAFTDIGSSGSTSITLPSNLVSRQQVVTTGTNAVTLRVGDNLLVGSGTVGANVGTGTLITTSAAQATVVLEPGTPGPIPPLAQAGASQSNVEPWVTVPVGAADVAFGGATISTIVWEQTGGPSILGSLSSTSTQTVTFSAPASLFGTMVQLSKTVTDSNGLTDVDVVTVNVLPSEWRAVIGGVEVPAQLFSVT